MLDSSNRSITNASMVSPGTSSIVDSSIIRYSGLFSGATRVPSFVGTDGFSRDVSEVVYGASVLLFGGLGLIIAFVVEMRLDKGKDKRS